jgi:Xaa-Pro dipeptidase
VGLEDQFSDHQSHLDRWLRDALEASASAGIARDGVVFHAGRSQTYHADDIEIPFRATPHFRRFVPLSGPDHLIIARPGEKPRLVRVVPDDYWYATPAPLDSWLLESLEVVEVGDSEAAVAAAGSCEALAFVGRDLEVARALGVASQAVEPAVLMAVLDWFRAYKTPYEISCMREAQRLAGLGHRAVRSGVSAFWSEFDLHLAFLAASGQVEIELPYPSIIAWDECGSVLHYPGKRRQKPSPGGSLLIDSGAEHLGYASDITRTYRRGEADSHPVFGELLEGMEALQQRLVARVGPGVEFVDLHRSAEAEIAELLRATGILRLPPDEARERSLIHAFLPHGLGHHLGLQVHDVGGRQIEATGALRSPPDDCPHLRTTRRLDTGHVVTIEPGLYFIPMLLDRLRGSASRDDLDWSLIDSLTPSGGIRIEDDVLVTHDGHSNLTRPEVPGHRDGS